MHFLISIIFKEFSLIHIQFISTPDMLILGPDELSSYIQKARFLFVLACIDDERDPSFLDPELERSYYIGVGKTCIVFLASLIFLPENIDAFKEKLFSSDELESFLSGHRYDDNTNEMNDLSLAEKIYMQFTKRHLFHNV